MVTLNLDPQLANELNEQGATLLLLGVPKGTVIGLDHQAFVTGPNFKGVKMIAPGAHFLSARAMNASGEVALSTGSFVWLEGRQVLVLVWDPLLELLTPMADAEEAERYALGVRRHDFDSSLAPYEMASLRQWQRLSQYIMPRAIHRLTPASGHISIMAEAEDLDLSKPSTAAEKKLVAQLQAGRAKTATPDEPGTQFQLDQTPGSGMHASVPTDDASAPRRVLGSDSTVPSHHRDAEMMTDMPSMTASGAIAGPPAVAIAAKAKGAKSTANGTTALQGGGDMVTAAPAEGAGKGASTSGRCSYTRVAHLHKDPRADAAQLTAANLDKSKLLVQLLHSSYKGQEQELLAELQFAFIAFVYGQSLDGFAQWKSLLSLLLSCEDAPLTSHTSFYVQLLQVLQVQLSSALAASTSTSSGISSDAPPSDSSSSSGGGASGVDSLLTAEILGDSFLRRLFAFFYEMLQECSGTAPAPLVREAEALKRLLHQKLGWNFDLQLVGEENDEYAPIVVMQDS